MRADITLGEVRDRKEIAQRQINDILREFYSFTGCKISRINTTVFECEDGVREYVTRVDVDCGL